jgi:uncharacterized protein YbjT (DUF2867 family)
MVTVAVAGGTGKVGRTIVEAIVAAGKHEVVVLSREVSLLIKSDMATWLTRVEGKQVLGTRTWRSHPSS